MALAVLLIVSVLFSIDSSLAEPANVSRWRKAPKPQFPKEALQSFAEGSVSVRAAIQPDGHVSSVKVVKTSGDPRLDQAATKAVSKWEMKRAAIKPSDLRDGCLVVFDFRQEAMLGAIYPGGVKAWFSGSSAGPWTFAPFPHYPDWARRHRHEGTVRVDATIGRQGSITHVEILQSSGHSELDQAAVSAVQHWRAHSQYEGKTIRFPIKFELDHPG